ncbi:MAG: diaminopimelate epimerase [Beijerinckiaceae bacterium]
MFSPLAGHRVLKMNGLGNKIVVLDLRGKTHVVTPEEARAIGKGQGLHYDQMMVLHDPRTPDTEAFVLIYNIDGSEAGACGNGTRCVAWVLAGQTGKDRFVVETRAGLLECAKLGDTDFSVDMGRPGLAWHEVPLSLPFADTTIVPLDTAFLEADIPADFTGVSMGNPHAIFFVADVEAHQLARTGPQLETHRMFPQKANISLAAITSRHAITLKVWERGAGLTLACGSGACAAAVAAHRRGLTGRDVTVTLPGGDISIQWRADDHVIMSGAVELEFEALLDPALFQGMA